MGAWRRDIQGLRAVAVSAVVLGHAGMPGLEGGYLGVDLFFVISGYLIAGIVLRERAAETFSLAAFWERRARRILPALLVVVAACLPPALWLLGPQGLENFGQSVVATVLFGNNVLLALTSGYWDLEAQFKPLLHTWSLGVEEQFYLLFPLLAGALALRRRLFAAVLLVLAGASLLAGWLLAARYPEASFYLLPTRVWQLAAGALVALAPPVPGRAGATLGAAGLVIIGVALAIAAPQATQPSLAALLAVTGAAAVLAAKGDRGPAPRLLGQGVAVWIGGISYSLYLWHQPLFAFRRVMAGSPPDFAAMLPLLAVLLPLAWLTARLVEDRWRKPADGSRLGFVTAVAGGGAVLVASGLALHIGNGLPGRFEATRGVAGLDPADYTARAFALRAAAFPEDGRGRVLIVGNSRARDFANIAMEAGATAGNAIVYSDRLSPCQAGGSVDPLLAAADLVVIEGEAWRAGCERGLARAMKGGARFLVLGPRQFGWSTEPLLRRSRAERAAIQVAALPPWPERNAVLARSVPAGSYLDYFAIAGDGRARLRLFDDAGALVSADGVHLTGAGTRFVAARLAGRPGFGWLHGADVRRGD